MVARMNNEPKRPMKASEIISVLTELIKTEGDLEVYSYACYSLVHRIGTGYNLHHKQEFTLE